jgi:hypothetical protein
MKETTYLNCKYWEKMPQSRLRKLFWGTKFRCTNEYLKERLYETFGPLTGERDAVTRMELACPFGKLCKFREEETK